jgi:hypothetical protein
MVLLRECGMMLVSLDNVHSPLSTNESSPHTLPPIIRIFHLKIGQADGAIQLEWVEHDHLLKGKETAQRGRFDEIASILECTLQSDDVRHEIELETTVKPKTLYSPLGGFLYGFENLRKRSQGDGDEAQAEELADILPGEASVF